MEAQEHQIEQNALATLNRAKEISVLDNDSYVKACQFELDVKALIKEADSYFEPQKKMTHATWQKIIEQHKRAVAPFNEALGIVTRGRITYEIEQERRRHAEELRMQEEARKKAEEEAQREALILEQLGETKLAEKVVSEVETPTVIVPKFTPKVEGISSRKAWRWRIKDESQVKRDYLCPNEIKINKIVSALGKNAQNVVGGIEAYEDTIPVRRAR